MTMMFNAARNGLRRTAAMTACRRQMATKGAYPVPEEALSAWYKVFGSSTAAYSAWIVIGVLATETLTGWVSTGLWRQANYGKTFDTVDWSQFKTEDEDDDDDDDDEDDDEEEEEDEEEEDDDE